VVKHKLIIQIWIIVSYLVAPLLNYVLPVDRKIKNSKLTSWWGGPFRFFNKINGTIQLETMNSKLQLNSSKLYSRLKEPVPQVEPLFSPLAILIFPAHGFLEI